MEKCDCCLKREADKKVCKLCMSKVVLDNVRADNPLIFQESVHDIFENIIKGDLDYIKEELERLRLELRIRKVKKK